VLRARPRRARIAFDGGPAEERLVEIVAVANARCFGGGMRVAPQADLTDSRLDVVVLEATHKLDLLGNFIPRVYRGAHLTHPRVRHRQAERVCVESDERLLLEADGELLGTAPAEFSLLPRALRLLV
jgi:diacylglycerol kinase family enzyme